MNPELMVILGYLAFRVFAIGTTWIGMSSAKKNIQSRLDLLNLKPTSRKTSKPTGLVFRYKLVNKMTKLVAIPGFGDLLFLGITLGRFSSKKTIAKAYDKALLKIDNDNLSDALSKIGNVNLSLYDKAKKEAGYLSVAGHSEIARQSIITLNNLLIDANLAGIDLRNAQSVQIAIFDTSELISSLVKEEQTGIHSNIDTYLNVVDSIKKDISGKTSVFMELDEPEKNTSQAR